MIRRPPRSTLSSSSAASDVYKRQVCSLGLLRVPPCVLSLERCCAGGLFPLAIAACWRWASLPTGIYASHSARSVATIVGDGCCLWVTTLKACLPLWLRLPQARAGSLCFCTWGSGLGQPTLKVCSLGLLRVPPWVLSLERCCACCLFPLAIATHKI